MRPRWTIAAVSVSLLAAPLPLRAQVAMAPEFDRTHDITSLGSPPGVPGNLGGLTILPSEPNALYLAGASDTAAGAIHRIELERDASGRVIAFATKPTRVIPAPGLFGGGINGSLITFHDDGDGPDELLGYLTSDDCFGELHTSSSGPIWQQDLTDAFGPGIVAAHAVVPCGFGHGGFLRFVTTDPARWYEGTFFLTAAFVAIIVPGDGPAIELDGDPRSLVFVQGSNPGFEGTNTVLIAKRDVGRIDGHRLDDASHPIPGSAFPFVTGIPGVAGMVVDPVTDDLLVSTAATERSSGHEILVVRGFDPCPSADLTGDGLVGYDDLLMLLGEWNGCTSCFDPCAAANLDCDCRIDSDDLAVLLSHWGPCR